MKILIADDSIVSRHLLEATLRKWGYEVVVACDGEEALNVLHQENAPALAILDWMMPGLTGLEVCRKIRKRAREPYTYILLLTSKSQKEDLIEGMDAGADDYITKPFDQHELQVRLRAGTRLVDLQAELMAAREALREQATKDSLTHLWNRSYIFDELCRELSRASREGNHVGVVMVDIDHFKDVNDNYGHFAGDAVLCETARRMQNAIRPYDSIGRYGGEEFLILLPGCDEHSSFTQAERLRKQLSQATMSLTDTSLCVTASFGVTTAVYGQPWTPEDLIRKADEALYLAKKLGRNRVEFLTSGPEKTTVRRAIQTEIVAQ
ncbi:MAG TPA: diguanylate cyclase [Bryobacteraceae bacterium]|nr:diguanylate cyclase [Bryobacteraceae bacterium]